MDSFSCDYIEVSYTKDLKISKIHDLLMSIFTYYTRERIKEEIEDLSSNADGNQRRINFLNNLLEKYSERSEYIRKSQILLDEYQKLSAGNSRNTLNIYNLGKKIVEDQEEINEKRRVIAEYLDLASEFIYIQRFTKIQNISRCPSCNEPFEKFEENSGMSVCACGYQISMFSSLSESNNSSQKTHYDDRNNFLRGMKRKQGKGTCKLPENLFNDLDVYFERTRGPKRSEIISQPPNEHGEKNGTSMEMMRTALQATGHTSQYNEIDFIMHIYWGWTLLDFSHLEEEMMNFYDETQEIYDKIPNRQRHASLNLNFRIFVQLRGLGYKIRRERFIFQESEKSLELHQEYWNIMCHLTGRPHFQF